MPKNKTLLIPAILLFMLSLAILLPVVVWKVALAVILFIVSVVIFFVWLADNS